MSCETEGTHIMLRVKTVGNGRENPLTIFAHISFYSVTETGESEMEYSR
jgi:hypothetical protein